MAPVNIPISEDFTNPLGEFVNYGTYETAQQKQLVKQKHVDLRSFQQNDVTVQGPMLSLDLLTMGDLDSLTMGQIEAVAAIVRSGEHWTRGTISAQSSLRHWNGLSLTCIAGTNVTQSVFRG